MKILKILVSFSCVLIIISCNKENSDFNSLNRDKYSPVVDFLKQNAPVMQTYVVSGSSGGIFISPQGTKITIPPNAFINSSNSKPITGDVSIQFKDLYKKSDMLLSDMPTSTYDGYPLKSGGEFFINATSNTSPLVIAPGKKINIEQPAALTGGIDTINIMQPFAFALLDTGSVWQLSPTDSVNYSINNYIFSLNQLNSPSNWLNCDNSSYFNNFPQTQLMLIPNDAIDVFHTRVYLVFKNISTVVPVWDNGVNFPYPYSPIGLDITLVAAGVKDGKLYSSFVPINITANKTVNFSLNLTTIEDFKSQLNALN